MKKYELTDETKAVANGTVLHRIRAVKDFTLADGTEVLAGDLGGWIEKEYNLSHIGSAWVYGNAEVYDDAEVNGNACVYGNAWVFGNAKVWGEAQVYGNALVYGDADYITFKNSWSSGRWFTYTSSNKMWKVGCFHGTGEELVKKAYADSELSGKCYEVIVRAVEMIELAKADALGPVSPPSLAGQIDLSTKG